MVKLSDALRGAADRAPMDGITVSTDSAARRVAMHRGLRGAATGIVGATAIGVVALGVIGPQGLANSSKDAAMTETAAAEAQPDSPSGDDNMMGSAAGSDAAGSRLAFGICGSEMVLPAVVDDSPVALDVEAPAAVKPGTTLPVAVQATVLEQDATSTSPEIATTAPDAYVTWDGIVVASVPAESLYSYGPADEQILNEDADVTRFAGEPGSSQSFAVDVPLVNCWDGAELPAADYGLTVRQGFLESELSAVAEESPSTETPAPPADSTELPALGAEGGTYFEVTGMTEFTIEGDRVDDPFVNYLGSPDAPVDPPVDPPTDVPPASLPDDALTPDVARQLYQAGITDTRWEMAAGTQRWIVTNDATDYADGAEPSDENAWAQRYFGCSMDGQADGQFPAESSTMELLDVTGRVPSRIGVSYGWVVDGNPEFSLSATNVSEYTLTNFSSTLNSQLYLVKDGAVVAEAWGVSPDPSGTAVLYNDTAMTMPSDSPDSYVAPMLGPGASVGSSFLWRDVQGCWDGDHQVAVSPGVYTLVSSQYVPVGDQQIYMAEPSMDVARGAGGDTMSPFDRDVSSEGLSSSGGDASFGWTSEGEPFTGSTQDENPETAIAPVPPRYDSIDLQVWTSFGTVTVN